MVTFWQPVVVAAIILIGFVISIFDGQGESRVNFKYTEMPIMRPVLIDTATKKILGFNLAVANWNPTMGNRRRFLLLPKWRRVCY